jgi:hypothetical protein
LVLFVSNSLALLVSEGCHLYEPGGKRIGFSMLSGFGSSVRMSANQTLESIPFCMELIWNTRAYLISSSNNGIHPDFSYKENNEKSSITDSGVIQYNSPSYGPISVFNPVFRLKHRDMHGVEVSLIVSAIHLILGYCSRNCSTPEGLKAMIDELASMLEIPADGTLMREFPVNYSTKQIEFDRLPQKWREDLPEILLILQATNHVLEIVKDMHKREFFEEKPLLLQAPALKKVRFLFFLLLTVLISYFLLILFF